MNKDNAKDFLPLVQALAEGKTIQINDGSESLPEWRDLVDVSFSHHRILYRIKPEPREWKASVVTSAAKMKGLATSYENGDLVAYDAGDEEMGYEVIRVREVTE